ncbi:MAG: hypothetical protein IH996_01545 [Proteobacteria bacterium]|nr:hypothetical protein [Pseudomonadota bacterium]
MAISSHSFGITKLTDKDAEKFNRQVIYGRPKREAIANAHEGDKLAREFENHGQVTVHLRGK